MYRYFTQIFMYIAHIIKNDNIILLFINYAK